MFRLVIIGQEYGCTHTYHHLYFWLNRSFIELHMVFSCYIPLHTHNPHTLAVFLFLSFFIAILGLFAHTSIKQQAIRIKYQKWPGMRLTFMGDSRPRPALSSYRTINLILQADNELLTAAVPPLASHCYNPSSLSLAS